MSKIDKKKIRFITNPFSGNKSKSKLKETIEKHLNLADFDFEICYTDYPRHATELSAEARDLGYYAVIAVGGDGTINEVATALKGSETALGIVPFGSGNGFSYHLGTRRDIVASIQNINDHYTLLVDTGVANGRFFINVAGLGLDATVAFKTKLNKKRGFIPYFINTIKESIGFRFMKLRITSDNNVMEGEYAMAVVANGSVYGYDFAVAPAAILDDGLFDVILVHKTQIFRYFLLVPRMLNKTFHKSTLVHYFKTQKITIESIGLSETPYFHVDGEGFEGEKSITFEIIPNSIRLITKQI